MKKEDNFVYIVTDGEFDGPVPGINSMLSFASVAVTAKGENLGEFEAVLEPIIGGAQATETMDFWQTIPEAYAAAIENPRPIVEVMTNFVTWVQSFKRDCLFVSHPLGLDGLWFDYYLRHYAKSSLYEGPWRANRLFNGAPLCLTSFAAGKLSQLPEEDCNYPQEWLGNQKHTHRAIDDARGYASLLAYLLMNPDTKRGQFSTN